MKHFKETLEQIKDRYYRQVMAGIMVTHHGDCKIYRANNPHCSCGLIHDLMPLSGYQETIFPKFWKHKTISDMCTHDVPPPRTDEEVDKILAQVGLVCEKRELTVEEKQEHEEKLRLIKEVFSL